MLVGSVGGNVGEAVGRWTDWVGRGVDKQPSWSTLGCRRAMARSPRPLGVSRIRTTSGRPTDRSGVTRCCWAQSRLPDRILTIDAPVVHHTPQHLASTHDSAGE